MDALDCQKMAAFKHRGCLARSVFTCSASCAERQNCTLSVPVQCSTGAPCPPPRRCKAAMLPRRCCQSKTRVWAMVGKQAQRDFRTLGANQCANRSKKFCASTLASREFLERTNTPTDLSSLALQRLWRWNAEEDDDEEDEYFNTSKHQKERKKKRKKISCTSFSMQKSFYTPFRANKQSVSA